MDPSRLSASLKQSREKCGFTVDYAARMVGVKPREIHKWESGASVPSDETLLLLSRLYGTSLADLMRDTLSAESASAPPHDKKDAPVERQSGLSEQASEHRSHTDETNDDARFLPHLMVEEHILWSGRPDPFFTTYRIPFPQRIFMLFWLGFAIFWTVSASAASGLFGLFGVPFVLIGIQMNFGAKYAYNKKKAHIYYALTNKRALILGDSEKPFFRSIDFSPAPSLDFEAGMGGKGSVYLNRYQTDFVPQNRYKRGIDVSFPDPTRHFLDIKDGARVYRMMESAIAETHRGDENFSE